MNRIKQLLLCVLFIFLVFIFSRINSYNSWYNEKIVEGFDEIENLKETPNEPDRKLMRYGNVITLYANIKARVDSISKTTNNKVLIPGNTYLKANKVSVELEEPAVIYYKSDLSTVLPYTDKSLQANWALIVSGGALQLFKLDSPEKKDSLINLYKKFL